MPAQVRERNSPSFFVHFYLLTNLSACGIIGRALTALALEISIIHPTGNFVKRFFAQILTIENPVFCAFCLL